MTTRNEDIRWLIQEAPGLLGLSGFDPSAMLTSQRTTVVSSDPTHDRMQERLHAAKRWGRLTRIWDRIERKHQRVLEGYYSERRTWLPGFEHRFGDVVGVVMAILTQEQLDQVRWWTTQDKNAADLKRLKSRAAAAAESAHAAWDRAKMAGALDEVCPRWER